MGEYDLYHARSHKYIKKIGNRYFYTQEEIRAYLDGKKPQVSVEKTKTYDYDSASNKKNMKDVHINYKKDGWDEKAGVRVGNKKIEIYNTGNRKAEKDDRWSVKRHGRLKTEYAEDGSEYTLDLASKNKYKARRKSEEAREKKLADWQESQGWRKSDAQIKAEKKRKRKKKIADAKSVASNNAKKTLNDLKKQSERGKKYLAKQRSK